MEIEFWWRHVFEILIIHKPSLGSLDVPHKIWARSVQPFWRLLDTNRQTPLCSPNINTQIVNKADENLSDYSFLSRCHYTKSKNYLKRRYRIRHWIPMFIGTPGIYKKSCFCLIILQKVRIFCWWKLKTMSLPKQIPILKSFFFNYKFTIKQIETSYWQFDIVCMFMCIQYPYCLKFGSNQKLKSKSSSLY